MDEEAFISAAHELRQSAVSVSRRYGATEVEAQDVAQETMIRLWQMLDTIDGRRRLNSLTTCIARNLTIDEYRRAARFHTTGTLPSDCPADIPAPDRRLEEAENEAWLRDRLRRLPSTEYAILHKRQVEGLTTQQIACCLALDERSVSTLLSRARHRLLEDIKRRRNMT